jgi:23S rRNA A1618 N6-methylase RlmF
MCNPPFYSSEEEAASLAGAKRMSPNAVFTGAHVEMLTPAEKVEHQTPLSSCCRAKMLNIKDSWYTSMPSRISSVFDVVTVLQHEHVALIFLCRCRHWCFVAQVSNYGVTEFVQGQTCLWGIAWLFNDLRLPQVRPTLHDQNVQLMFFFAKWNDQLRTAGYHDLR